jgi:hypothetical protein
VASQCHPDNGTVTERVTLAGPFSRFADEM